MAGVAIVGSAKTTRSLAPFADPTVKIWSTNEAPLFPWLERCDALFQMHPRWSFTRINRVYPAYWEWLQQNHDFPIYMQQTWPDVPASRAYPLREIVEELHLDRLYFTNTIPYMIAMAIFEGYDWIGLYGVNQSSQSEYSWQRDCTTYWIGRAEGMGIKVHLPDGCPLLQGKLYGYEGEVDLDPMQIEIRVAALYKKELELEKALADASGVVAALIGFSGTQSDPELDKAMEAAIADQHKAMAELYSVRGARHESEYYLGEITALLRAAGEQPVKNKEYADLGIS